MSTHTTIEWTDATWNPVRGCSRVSEGCRNCYAERLAATRLAHTPAYQGLATMTPDGPRWTGRVVFDPVALEQPLRWRKPRRVFVNSMSDLFHEGLTNEQIAALFGVMAACPQHTFQVLTKRPARMLHWFGFGIDMRQCVLEARCTGGVDIGWPLIRNQWVEPRWPLPNVWIGVSVEDQATADARIPLLLETPAAVRFVSAEPLLGPVDLTGLRYELPGVVAVSTLTRAPVMNALQGYATNRGHTRLDWVIAGGESGPGARPMHPDWARSLRDQCAEAGVAFHFKQWGDWAPLWDAYIEDARDHPVTRVGGVTMCRYGKAAAGRLLDGREHNGFPGGAA